MFATEPTTESPLFDLPQVVVTPHLGASTAEAQDKAGDTIAEQVELALAGEFVPFAVNVAAAEASSTVRPFLPLAERLGQLYAGLVAGVPDTLEIAYEGQLGEADTRILTLSVLKGVFGSVSDEPVSYVNAPRLAAERGVEVRESSSPVARDYVNLITVRGGDHAIGGTLVGLRGEPAHRDGRRPLGRRPAGRPHARGPQRGRARDDRRRHRRARRGRPQHRRHAPRPLGRRRQAALMVLATDVRVPDEVQARIRALPGVVSVAAL